MKKLLLFYFIHSSLLSMAQDYKIENKSTLTEILKKGTVIKRYQREDNLSIVYELSDSRIILFPCAGNKGLLFKDAAIYNETLKGGKIPLKDDNNFFESNQDRVMLLPENIDSIIKNLGDKLHLDLRFENLSDSYFDSISVRIKELKINNDKNEIYFALGTYVGAIIQRTYHAKWVFDVEYGVNKYYEPRLYTNEKIFYPWLDVSRYLGDGNKLPLSHYIRSAFRGFDYKREN